MSLVCELLYLRGAEHGGEDGEQVGRGVDDLARVLQQRRPV